MEGKHIVLIGFEHDQGVINQAGLKDEGYRIKSYAGIELQNKQRQLEILAFVEQKAGTVLVKDTSGDVELEEFCQMLLAIKPSIPLIPLGAELVQKGFCTVDFKLVRKIQRYFLYGGVQNVSRALSYIQIGLIEQRDPEGMVAEPQFEPFDGIFHPAAPHIFNSLEDYLNWYTYYRIESGGKWQVGKDQSAKRVGLLFHRSSWITNNLAVESALIKELEKLEIGVIPVFSYGSKEPELGNKDFDEVIEAYFSRFGRLNIAALINFQIFMSGTLAAGTDLFNVTTLRFSRLNIPIFRPLISYASSRKDWEASSEGLVMEIPWSFTTPERQGMLEPILVGCRDEAGKSEPLPERIARFAARVKKWIALSAKSAASKKLAIFIHNAPCSGVEATIGMGAGLDVFASVLNIMNMLEAEGWSITAKPGSGADLHNLFMQRKAYSDFRWTAVEDILESGGCLFQMPLDGPEGYLQFYKSVDPEARARMEKTWGPPPGKGMVYEDRLVITGIAFGNVLCLVQPKRGCYGAKCTGEVCKILQDPRCPPPHQYLATYRYVEEIFKADAVLHVGTQGSLEFLPGKSNALSGQCFPDIVIGNLPNFYVYNTGVGSEAILAKRRSYAAITGHLPSIYRGTEQGIGKIIGLINEYLEAVTHQNTQAASLERQILQEVGGIKGAGEIIARKPDFRSGVVQLKKVLVQTLAKPNTEKRHIFGKSPDIKEAIWFIKEVLQPEIDVFVNLREQFADDAGYHSFILVFIEKSLSSRNSGSTLARNLFLILQDETLTQFFDWLAEDIKTLFYRLSKTGEELVNLSHGLQGQYIAPGPSGMPDENGWNIIPTGRNLYLLDVEKIPTKAAYEVGTRLAEELLKKYLEEEGKYPEKIAMNMISLDISRAKGEQLSQILFLLGVKPVWENSGKVTGLEIIPTEGLNRPRIDVVVRISGVLRDCYPGTIELLDEAVCMVAALPEDEAINYVRKHTRQISEALASSGTVENLERRATIRIFGDQPGTYGAGVDLALKASAWKDETDLARYFVYFSSYAYGKELYGESAGPEFVENVNKADIAYDTTYSKRYDVLDSSFGASVQGGFGLVKKVMQGYELRQYHGSSETGGKTRVSALKDNLLETVEQTLLNPLWKEAVKETGYAGAAKLMSRLQNVFEWQCLTGKIEDKILDSLVTEYITDPVMQQWFAEHNRYAMEEISRRFLELNQRGKWNADQAVLQRLQSSYLKIEGDMEEGLSEVNGDIQGGNIEIIAASDLVEWEEKLKSVNELFGKS